MIPFFAGGAQGREIEYCVAGWRKHFKENYQIVLVGDYHKVVDTGEDITFVECPRVDDIHGQYRPHIDFASKFRAFHKAFPKVKEFVFCADDVYAVNDFDLYDIAFLKYRSASTKASPVSPNGFHRDKFKTVELLKKEKLPQRNYTTHLPQLIEWKKLEALLDKYDMDHNSYVFEDLYFNTYYPKRVPFKLHIDYDNLKCGVYRPNPRISYIEAAFKGKIWIQNSVEGWIPQLDKMLSDYYGI